jgi:drug/metabolite transporter (DMT)-like permease
LAVTMIVTGIMLLPLNRFDRRALGDLGRHLRGSAMGFALLAAAATAAYTIWDKYAIGFLDTFLYFAGYTMLLGAWFAVALTREPRDHVRAQLRTYSGTIVLIGFLIAASYLLVLIALRDGMPTQVLAVRQLSIPIGVLLGWRLLHETLSVPRTIGSVLITCGCLLAAVL